MRPNLRLERETRFELATPSLAIIWVESKLQSSLDSLFYHCYLLTIRGSREGSRRGSVPCPDVTAFCSVSIYRLSQFPGQATFVGLGEVR